MYCPEQNVRKTGWLTMVATVAPPEFLTVHNGLLQVLNHKKATHELEDELELTLHKEADVNTFTVLRNTRRDYVKSNNLDIADVKAPCLARVAAVDGPSDTLEPAVRFLLEGETVDTLLVDATVVTTAPELKRFLLALVRLLDARTLTKSLRVTVCTGKEMDAPALLTAIRPGCRLPDTRVTAAFAASQLPATTANGVAYMDAARLLVARYCGSTRPASELMYAWEALAQLNAPPKKLPDTLSVDGQTYALDPAAPLPTWCHVDKSKFVYLGDCWWSRTLKQNQPVVWVGPPPRAGECTVKTAPGYDVLTQSKTLTLSAPTVPAAAWQLHDTAEHVAYYRKAVTAEIAAIEASVALGTVYRLSWAHAAVLMPFVAKCVQYMLDDMTLCRYAAYSSFWGVDPAMAVAVPQQSPAVRVNALMVREEMGTPTTFACAPALYLVLQQLAAVERACAPDTQGRRWRQQVHAELPLPFAIFEFNTLCKMYEYRKAVLTKSTSYTDVMRSYDNKYVAATAQRLEQTYQTLPQCVQPVAYTSCTYVLPCDAAMDIKHDAWFAHEPMDDVFRSFKDPEVYRFQQGTYTKINVTPNKLGIVLDVEVGKPRTDDNSATFEQRLHAITSTTTAQDLSTGTDEPATTAVLLYLMAGVVDESAMDYLTTACNEIKSTYHITNAPANITNDHLLDAGTLIRALDCYNKTLNAQVFMDVAKSLYDVNRHVQITHVLSVGDERCKTVIGWCRDDRVCPGLADACYYDTAKNNWPPEEEQAQHAYKWILYLAKGDAEAEANRIRAAGDVVTSHRIHELSLMPFRGTEETMMSLAGVVEPREVVVAKAPETPAEWQFVVSTNPAALQATHYVQEDLDTDSGAVISKGTPIHKFDAAITTVPADEDEQPAVHAYDAAVLLPAIYSFTADSAPYDVASFFLRSVSATLVTNDTVLKQLTRTNADTLAVCAYGNTKVHEPIRKRVNTKAQKILQKQFYILAPAVPFAELAKLSVYLSLEKHVPWPTEAKTQTTKWQSRGLQIGVVMNDVLVLVAVAKLVNATEKAMQESSATSAHQYWFPMSVTTLVSTLTGCSEDVAYYGSDVDAIESAHRLEAALPSAELIAHCEHPLARGVAPAASSALQLPATTPAAVAAVAKRKTTKLKL